MKDIGKKSQKDLQIKIHYNAFQDTKESALELSKDLGKDLRT